jgi:hypothetical protein
VIDVQRNPVDLDLGTLQAAVIGGRESLLIGPEASGQEIPGPDIALIASANAPVCGRSRHSAKHSRLRGARGLHRGPPR